MGELLALTSALCFGTTHFLSGLVSRRHHGVTVAACAQAGGTAVSLVPVLLTHAAPAPPSALAWGALSGVGTGVGVACLYRAMNTGPMSVVVPVSDITAVGVPVAAGIAFLGDRPSPSALTGIALALPALWLISRGGTGHAPTAQTPTGRTPTAQMPTAQRPTAQPPTGRRAAAPLVTALIAGLGLAVHFFALARVPADAGWWPVVVSRVLSVAVILALLPAVGASVRLPWRAAVTAAAAGALGTLATVLYLLATRQELLSVAVVLSALYPAVPVLLALTVLRERITRPQVAGVLGAGAALALIALG
ncbi:DMT family transporter [Streptomyces sp. Rer75]|uniref:DMT family transporter n=1 Tax=Streptomyces sp. Rer75 TaxID=2750011 RepID=UPI0015D0AF9D|nr:DMT family transporter [Streptomyces sp. Rer75]QLH24918.1 DMT family transporter [Streptomyces sp. Rer75]